MSAHHGTTLSADATSLPPAANSVDGPHRLPAPVLAAVLTFLPLLDCRARVGECSSTLQGLALPQRPTSQPPNLSIEHLAQL